MISSSYWLRSSNPKQQRPRLRLRRYKPSRPHQYSNCRSYRRIHSIHLLRLCNSLPLSIAVGLRQLPLASRQCPKQVFLKVARHPFRPLLSPTSHRTYSHSCKVYRLSHNSRIRHNRRKAQRLCQAHMVLSHQHSLQDRCVPRCHRIWQGHHRQYRCKVIIKPK
jgi:hypothetical protein